MERVKLVVKQRDAHGTRATRRLRREGFIPGVLYGHGNPAQSLAVEPHALRDALSTEAGTHAVLEITFEGQKKVHRAIVKDLALDKVKHHIIHLDLEEVRLDQVVESQVAIHFEGTSAGVKMGGMLDETTREVTIKGLVTDIPEHLTIDISELELGDSLHIGDLHVPEGLEVLDDPESVLCSILAPRKLEAEEEEALEAAEEAAAAAEPEVVGRRKEEPEE